MNDTDSDAECAGGVEQERYRMFPCSYNLIPINNICNTVKENSFLDSFSNSKIITS